MPDLSLKLKNAPIIEAVLDLDCDMPPGLVFSSLEGPARASLREQYPQFRKILLQEHNLEAKPEAPAQISTQQSLHGFQFLMEDGKQIVQVRSQGFSFNRLAPYSTFDDYLPEIQRAWNIFIKIAAPVRVRVIRLRYINRILLPMTGKKVNLDDYLKIGPHLPDEEKLEFVGFVNQHTAVEMDTGNQLNLVLAAQPPENHMIPVIFDITAAAEPMCEPDKWGEMVAKIQSLRNLNNRVFRNTLTPECINLFQK